MNPYSPLAVAQARLDDLRRDAAGARVGRPVPRRWSLLHRRLARGERREGSTIEGQPAAPNAVAASEPVVVLGDIERELAELAELVDDAPSVGGPVHPR